MTVFFAILIILFGFILIMADILFIPGGVVAFFGGFFILSAIVASYKVLGKETAFVLTMGSVILAGLLAYISVKFRLWNRFVRQGNEDKKGGFHSFKGPLDEQIGKEALTLTALRPSGTVLVEGRKFDAISESNFIEADKKAIVLAVSAGQLKVREIN